MRRISLLKAFFILGSLLALLNGNARAESHLVSVSRSRKEPMLFPTVFRRSDYHYERARASAPSGDSSNDFGTMIGGPDDGRYPWKENIVTTIFWVGEKADKSNPVPNAQSAWDSSWMSHYGGYDDPKKRANFIPARFTPKENPFYVALPYNDLTHNHTKSEASRVIPWFKNSFVRDGQSVCKDHWLAIRYGIRTCFGQWEDVGPFHVDHWQYVFGNERPHSNRNHAAGLDVSPAVRDYLGMSGTDVCDWKFVNLYEVPNGPWALYGGNNSVARLRHQGTMAMAKK
jgi:hypothetical protein